MARRILALALVAVIATGLPGCAERRPAPPHGVPVSFYREYVTVEPSDGRTRVVGDYYFRNDSDDEISLAIRYPFPVDRFHVYPFRVRAWVLKDGEFRPIGFVHGSDAVSWPMDFAPREERVVRVEYVQQIVSEHAIYIVTTTKEWGKPIEIAEFEFRVPASLGPVDLSFEPDRTEAQGDTVVYYMRRTGFLPDADLTVTWGDRREERTP